MNLSEQDARSFQKLYFHWDEKNGEFYRDYNCSGNDYMKVYFDDGLKQWVLYEFTETAHEDEGWREDYTNFDKLDELFKYFA